MATTAPANSDDYACRTYSVVAWTLRVAVALQAIGVGLQRLGLGLEWEDDSAVFGLLLYDWRWPEEVAQRVDDLGAWLYFACGVSLLLIPAAGGILRAITGRAGVWFSVWIWQLPLSLTVAVWQAVLTTADWYRGGFFMSEWALISEAARFALPLVLFVLTPLPGSDRASPSRLAGGIWLLRIAAAMTFVGHGLNSLYLNPKFVDFLLAAAAHISWDLSQSTAETVLRAIGVVDLAAAALMMLKRWRIIAFYMALWALVAATARLVHSGPESHFELLIRSGNYCVPLIVGLFWHLSRRK
ncbi:MAG: hypothetical protein VB876_00925 [Pirellulales bacterium]